MGDTWIESSDPYYCFRNKKDPVGESACARTLEQCNRILAFREQVEKEKPADVISPPFDGSECEAIQYTVCFIADDKQRTYEFCFQSAVACGWSWDNLPTAAPGKPLQEGEYRRVAPCPK